jgi:uncharacterized membrane protein
MQKNKIAIIVLSVLLAVSAGSVAYTEGVKLYNKQINQAYTKGVVDVFGTVKSKGQVSVQLDDGTITLIQKQ